jgi:hypothetical protein
VYDVKKRNLNQIELINHYNETLIAEDMEPDEEEEEDELVRRLLMQGYDYDYVFTVFPA